MVKSIDGCIHVCKSMGEFMLHVCKELNATCMQRPICIHATCMQSLYERSCMHRLCKGMKCMHANCSMHRVACIDYVKGWMHIASMHMAECMWKYQFIFEMSYMEIYGWMHRQTQYKWCMVEYKYVYARMHKA